MWDIESSHNQVLTFGLYQQDIPHENIITDRHIYCISYKWYGEKKTHVISITDDKKRFSKDIHDDYYVVSEFQKVFNEADAHVTHNGDKFDLKMLNARLVFNGLKPLPQIISLDTYKMSKRYFSFNSNRLDYLAKKLGHSGKLDNPKNLWLDCFKGDIKALNHMAKYNKRDVEALEYVFTKLIPFVKSSQLNMALFLGGTRCVNPVCGSPNITWQGYKQTKTRRYRQFKCKDCGSWGSNRLAENNNVEVK